MLTNQAKYLRLKIDNLTIEYRIILLAKVDYNVEIIIKEKKQVKQDKD